MQSATSNSNEIETSPAALVMRSESIETFINNHHIFITRHSVQQKDKFFCISTYEIYLVQDHLYPCFQDIIVKKETSLSAGIIFNFPSKLNTWHVMRHLQLIKPCGVPIHHLPLKSWLQQGMTAPLVAQELPIENHWHFPTCTTFLCLFKTKKWLLNFALHWFCYAIT